MRIHNFFGRQDSQSGDRADLPNSSIYNQPIDVVECLIGKERDEFIKSGVVLFVACDHIIETPSQLESSKAAEQAYEFGT